MATDERPWLKYYGKIPADIVVPDKTMYELLAETAGRVPDRTAVLFLGTRLSFPRLMREIDQCAAALRAQGITAGDSVLVSLPNIPNVVVLFYALNKIGARAVMTHPLSSSDELKHFAVETNSRWAVGVDMFYDRLQPVLEVDGMQKLIIAHISDYLGAAMTVGFKLTKGRKIAPVPKDNPAVIPWSDFMKGAGESVPYVRPHDPAEGSVVLFSGGTTSLPKGIELSSHAFNALAASMIAITNIAPGNSVLAIMPAFHGFGLGLCIHSTLTGGAASILVPEVGTTTYVEALIKYKPSFIAGVPTLFQALLQMDEFAKVDFSQLRGAYSGGDSLTPDLKHRFDAALKAQGSHVELEEGYGLTECVTASVLSPTDHYRTGSVGVPIPGTLAKIVKPDTIDEVPYGTDGEICIQGETLMNCYINDAEATAATLRRHADGRVWLHSGDIGSMDADGYLYFVGRIKRIIKVSGVSVYPAQVEQLLEAHPKVKTACVIGIPDDYQMSSVKAFIVPEDGVKGDDALRDELRAYAKEHLMKWSVPRHIEFRDSLPQTKVGKIAYTELEKEEAAKAAAAKAAAGNPAATGDETGAAA